MNEATLPPAIRGLLHSGAYPHAVDRVELIQTHISYLLLAGDRVYKVKKPLDLGFLDFTTLEKRRHFCAEEVRLNRRTCPGMYLGVVPVTRDGEEYGIGRAGEVVDYAVEMKRLPAEGMLDRLVAADAVTHEMIGRLVARLADFHAQAEAGEGVRRAGGYEALGGEWSENFEQTRPYIGRTLSGARFDRVRAYVDSYLERERPLLQRREAEGRIRDGHGDLRSDSVCFDPAAPGGICIFDCIEFNERFRCCDTGLDVAFLAMDLDFRGRRDLSDLFVGLYAAAAGDSTLPLVLDFYKCYRAWVRGKVESIFMDEPEVPAKQRSSAKRRAAAYFRLAEAYARRKQTRDVVMVIGPSGVGKSALAGPLAARLGAALLSTDVVRKGAFGEPPTARRAEDLDVGLYAAEARERVYAEMAQRAGDLLADGRGVVLDGTYLESRLRAPVVARARSSGQRLLVVECQAPEAVVEARQRERADQPWTTSDAGMAVYRAQKARYEPPTELAAGERLALDSTMPLEGQIEAVVAALRQALREPQEGPQDAALRRRR